MAAKTRYRLLTGLNWPKDPAVEARLRAGEQIPPDEIEWVRAEKGEVRDDVPALSVPWLLEGGQIEPAAGRTADRTPDAGVTADG